MSRSALLTVLCLAWLLPARGQPVLTVQGGPGLAATALDADAAGAAGGIGLQFDLTPRLYRMLALRLEAGVTFLGPLCFDAGERCEGERPRRPKTFMLSGALGVGMLTRSLRLGTRAEGVDISVGVYAGREWVAAGFGSGHCLNCREEGLSLRGGFYLEPALELFVFPPIGMGLSYRTYSAGADLRGRVTVRLIARSDG
ncbi:MAG: hypothetical protein ACE5G0_02185 [Rhodothermales bacterium]